MQEGGSHADKVQEADRRKGDRQQEMRECKNSEDRGEGEKKKC